MTFVAPSVVCGIDGSDPAATAFQVAQTLSRRLGARLVAVRVEDDAERGTLEGDARFQGADVVTRAERGDPAARLAAVALEENAELVVVGSRGRHPVAAAVLGSVSADLARLCRRPVVVVPVELELPWPSEGSATPSLVCGIDGSQQSERAAQLARRLGDALGLRVVLAHAYRAKGTSRAHREILEDLPMLLEREREAGDALVHRAVAQLGESDAEGRAVLGDAVEGLESVARDEYAELFVVGSRGRGSAEAALLGSTSTALAASAPQPVVVLPVGAELRAQPED